MVKPCDPAKANHAHMRMVTPSDLRASGRSLAWPRFTLKASKLRVHLADAVHEEVQTQCRLEGKASSGSVAGLAALTEGLSWSFESMADFR